MFIHYSFFNSSFFIMIIFFLIHSLPLILPLSFLLVPYFLEVFLCLFILVRYLLFILCFLLLSFLFTSFTFILSRPFSLRHFHLFVCFLSILIRSFVSIVFSRSSFPVRTFSVWYFLVSLVRSNYIRDPASVLSVILGTFPKTRIRDKHPLSCKYFNMQFQKVLVYYKMHHFSVK